MSDRTKWRLAYAASYGAGLAVLVVLAPLVLVSSLRLIARTAREHADEFFPDGASPQPTSTTVGGLR